MFQGISLVRSSSAMHVNPRGRDAKGETTICTKKQGKMKSGRKEKSPKENEEKEPTKNESNNGTKG